MVMQTNAFTTYSAKGNREDLANVIYNIDPAETPFMSGAGRGKASAVLHEWQTDAFDAATTANAVLEGDVVTGTASVATVRMTNYCQISRKDMVVTGTQEVVDKAGRASEMDYQTAKRGKELKRDIETILCSNQRGKAGGATTARLLRGLEAFIVTNSNRNTGSTSGTKGKSSTAPTSATGAATDAGDTRTFTEALLKRVLQLGFTSGANFKFMLVGPHSKQRVSTFTGRESAQQNIAETKIQAAADLYASDFGTIKIVASNFSRPRSAVLVDPEYASVDYLRPIKRQELAKNGDAERAFILAEYTLAIKNEKAFGVVADIKTTS